MGSSQIHFSVFTVGVGEVRGSSAETVVPRLYSVGVSRDRFDVCVFVLFTDDDKIRLFKTSTNNVSSPIALWDGLLFDRNLGLESQTKIHWSGFGRHS